MHIIIDKLRRRFTRAAMPPSSAVSEEDPSPLPRSRLLGETAPAAATSSIFRDACTLMKPFWSSPDHRGQAYSRAAAVAGLNGAIVGFAALNAASWAGMIDAFIKKDVEGLVFYMSAWGAGALAASCLKGRHFGIRQRLKMQWRQNLHETATAAWLNDEKVYYHLLNNKKVSNPDHRLTEDVKWFVDHSVQLADDLTEKAIRLSTFAGILWGMSSPVTFTLAQHSVTISAPLLWAGLAYSAVGTWIIHKKGHPLTALFDRERNLEAEQRAQLMSVLRNGSTIAQMNGEEPERNIASAAAQKNAKNWNEIVGIQQTLLRYSEVHTEGSKIIPYMINAGNYWTGKITFGGIHQAAVAFENVQTAFSWPLKVYPLYSQWKTITKRLKEFFNAASALQKEAETGPKIKMVSDDKAGAVRLEKLTIRHAGSGNNLIEDVNLQFDPGDRVLLMGPSGSGKSTVMRVLAGLHRAGEGNVTRPGGALPMLIPQQPYLPNLPLRDILSYPHCPERFEESEMVEALLDAGLDRLTPLLGSDIACGHILSGELSGGEQQRLRLAAVLLQKPPILMIDEGTSALDEESGRHFYGTLVKLLEEKLPQTILLSVAHQKHLIPFHTKYAYLEDKKITEMPEEKFHEKMKPRAGVSGKSSSAVFDTPLPT